MPYKPQTREYRAVSEPFRAIEGGFVVEGYATTFDAPYDMGAYGARECIRSTALAGADLSDVIFRYDHEGMVMARQRNHTLELEIDSHGLKVRADIGGCAAGRDLYEAIKNGLVDRMSWAFAVADDGWEYDEDTRTATVTDILKVYDVAAVGIPADQDTEIQARSAYAAGVAGCVQRQEMARLASIEKRNRLKARFEFEMEGLCNAIR